MKNILAFSLISIFVSGCSMISSNYVPSLEMQRQSISPKKLQVFYDKNEVPFKYKETGRIFLKNINYWADRDPAGQINKIKQEAAEYGADAVIIVNETRKESSFTAFNDLAGGNAGEVFQYFGIAIIKE